MPRRAKCIMRFIIHRETIMKTVTPYLANAHPKTCWSCGQVREGRVETIGGAGARLYCRRTVMNSIMALFVGLTLLAGSPTFARTHHHGHSTAQSQTNLPAYRDWAPHDVSPSQNDVPFAPF
jgi:tetrahydromethanopterin S-methyltransferase subunit E